MNRRCKCGATAYPKQEQPWRYWCPTCGRGTESPAARRDRILAYLESKREPR